jgi:uncharacterized protein (TIGR03067 family)
MAADAPKVDSSKELKKFQGTWRTVSMVIDGRVVPNRDIQGRRVIITGKEYVIVDGEETIQRGVFKIDPAQSPKQIDTIPADGSNAGKADRGIYEFDGGKLRLCYAPPGKDRPTDFSADDGSSRWLAVDEREKPEGEKP